MQALRRFLGTRGAKRIAILAGLLALLGAVFASLDLQPNLKRVKVAVLSGPEGGNYHAVVERLSATAAPGGGRVTNVATDGSVDNVARLAAARENCDAQFALAQDGLDWPAGLELVARLPRAESVFFLGRNIDGLGRLSDLEGLRIGVGPEGSGTNLLARRVLEGEFLAGLHVRLSNHDLAEQLTRIQSGDLDLGVIVVDEDAPIIVRAVRDLGLHLLSLPQADVIARRLPRVRTGRIGAGQFDPIRVLPPTDVTVLRVDTLLIGNSCARRSATVGLLTLLSRELPDFVRRNQDTPNATGLPLSGAARRFFEDGGPDLATAHAPWAVDIMPLSNWIYAITAVSLLFNAMTQWSLFRLWRVDARRVGIEAQLRRLVYASVTPPELARLQPRPEHLLPEHREEVRQVIARLEGLAELCRQYSLSWVTDMGQEMPYRYQEQLVAEWLGALRGFCIKVDRAIAGSAAPLTS